MLPLDDPRWAQLSHAYGPASDIPALLKHAEQLPADMGNDAEPYCSLWSALCHQGTVYSASYAALPHLVRIVEENHGTFRWTLLALVHAIEAARSQGKGPPVPDGLSDAYHRAIARIPALASQLLSGTVSELELRMILAACASTKGFPSMGEAICELTPETIRRLLDE